MSSSVNRNASGLVNWMAGCAGWLGALGALGAFLNPSRRILHSYLLSFIPICHSLPLLFIFSTLALHICFTASYSIFLSILSFSFSASRSSILFSLLILNQLYYLYYNFPFLLSSWMLSTSFFMLLRIIFSFSFSPYSIPLNLFLLSLFHLFSAPYYLSLSFHFISYSFYFSTIFYFSSSPSPFSPVFHYTLL